jgi:predicted Fe-Mo cluster-binding NifX family protein
MVKVWDEVAVVAGAGEAGEDAKAVQMLLALMAIAFVQNVSTVLSTPLPNRVMKRNVPSVAPKWCGSNLVKIVITSLNGSIEAQFSPRFGRCAYFIFVDTDTIAWEAFPNPAANARGGAGTQAAQYIASQGAQAVISGHFGPNAYEALQVAGIQMFSAGAGRVQDLVDEFSAGRLKQVTVPGESGHHGGRGRH